MAKLPLEHEIETVFVHHVHTEMERFAVIGRQVRLPSGILDLLLLSKSVIQFTPVVVEVKRDLVDAEACAQVIGYMGQINVIVRQLLAKRVGTHSALYEAAQNNSHNLQGWLIGRRITSKAKRILASHNLVFLRYSIGEHGLIEFSERYESFVNNRLPLENYTPPPPLEAVAGAIEFNARQELSQRETWVSSYPEDNPAITGKDFHPDMDPGKSVTRWEWGARQTNRKAE